MKESILTLELNGFMTRAEERNIHFRDIECEITVKKAQWPLDVRPPEWIDDASWHRYQLLREYSRTGRGFKLDERYLIDEVIIYENKTSKIHAFHKDLWEQEPSSWVGINKWKRLCEIREILEEKGHSMYDPLCDEENDLEVDLMESHYRELKNNQ